MIEFKSRHFEPDAIPLGIRWDVAYPISRRQLEEVMEGRGAAVGHAALSRWILKEPPAQEREFLGRNRSVGSTWQVDDMYVCGQR